MGQNYHQLAPRHLPSRFQLDIDYILDGLGRTDHGDVVLTLPQTGVGPYGTGMHFERGHIYGTNASSK